MACQASNNNCPREDCIFKGKVKDVLLRDHGNGGIMRALLDFHGRHETAKANGQDGLRYDEFLSFLEDNGVELTDFEAKYLCRSFDDDGNGCISDGVFIRHLIGVNKRRQAAIQQAWDRVDKNAEGEAPQAALVATHDDILRAGASHGACSDICGTVCGGERTQLKSSWKHASARATHGRRGEPETLPPAEEEQDGAGDGDDDTVSREEFFAYYAALSQYFPSDEAFERFLLREWQADAPTKPKLNETARDWGEEGDPLAVDGPHLVRTALKQELGRSSKEYNYTHLARQWPPRDPLPPLDRTDMMRTTQRTHFCALKDDDRALADPLLTRRGQPQ